MTNLRNRSFFATVIRSRFVWLAAVFVIAGGACLVAGLDLFWLEWQYHSAALQTHGTVLGKSKSRSSGGAILGTGGGGWTSGPGGSGAISYTVHYRYETSGGASHEGEDDVGGSYWEKLKPGDSLQVLYLPRFPNHSRLWRGTRLLLPACLLGVGVPMTTMGVILEFLVVSDLRRKYVSVHSSHWNVRNHSPVGE